MRKTTFLISALGAMTLLSACAGGYYEAGYGGPDVYYDGFYGPYTEGYWGPDSYFYYRGGDGRFLRDESRHFRHEGFRGARHYHARDRDFDHR